MDLNATSLLTTAPSPNLDCPVKPDNDDSVRSTIQLGRRFSQVDDSVESPSCGFVHQQTNGDRGTCRLNVA